MEYDLSWRWSRSKAISRRGRKYHNSRAALPSIDPYRRCPQAAYIVSKYFSAVLWMLNIPQNPAPSKILQWTNQWYCGIDDVSSKGLLSIRCSVCKWYEIFVSPLEYNHKSGERWWWLWMRDVVVYYVLIGVQIFSSILCTLNVGEYFDGCCE